MSPTGSSSNEHKPSLRVPDVVRPLRNSGLKSGVTTLAFWTAIVLPFLHVPLLATGLDTVSTAVAFAVLVALNVVAAVVGHPHRQD